MQPGQRIRDGLPLRGELLAGTGLSDVRQQSLDHILSGVEGLLHAGFEHLGLKLCDPRLDLGASGEPVALIYGISLTPCGAVRLRLIQAVNRAGLGVHLPQRVLEGSGHR